MGCVRILISDKQPIFREGLRHLLETDPRLVIVGHTGDEGSGAIALVSERKADVLLLGMAVSGAKAVATLQELLASGSPVRTLVMTAHVDSPEVMRALQMGARGVIPKDSKPEVLFNSIHSVMEGHFWIGSERVSQTAGGLRRLETARRRSRAFGLTRREIDIVRAVIDGYTNKEIAHRSSISENTVKSHLAHIFNKLGASNRVELALFASHHRLLDGV